MSIYLLFLIPTVLALTAIGIAHYRYFNTNNMQKMVHSIVEEGSKSMQEKFSIHKLVDEKLHSSGAWTNLSNNIDKQIDHILQVQLKERVPIIFNLIGDDFLNEMRPLFQKTLHERLPQMIQDFTKKIDAGTENLFFNDKNKSKLKGRLNQAIAPKWKKIQTGFNLICLGIGLGSTVIQSTVYYLL